MTYFDFNKDSNNVNLLMILLKKSTEWTLSGTVDFLLSAHCFGSPMYPQMIRPCNGESFLIPNHSYDACLINVSHREPFRRHKSGTGNFESRYCFCPFEVFAQQPFAGSHDESNRLSQTRTSNCCLWLFECFVSVVPCRRRLIWRLIHFHTKSSKCAGSDAKKAILVSSCI